MSMTLEDLVMKSRAPVLITDDVMAFPPIRRGVSAMSKDGLKEWGQEVETMNIWDYENMYVIAVQLKKEG